ncbi:MAG: flagellar assembly regulator FliX [Rhodobacteraceae bacterium]|nr:flagellar assembly regulator FliX [Paracoccaceae bacterium]
MRITGQKPTTGVKGRETKKSGSSAGSKFTPSFGEDTVQTTETTSSSGIQSMDALLALQEVASESPRKKKALQHGHALLDQLEEMRAELLAGRMSEDRLEALSGLVSEEADSGDEEIDGVLREVELRVKVELAKLGKFMN